MRRNRLLRELRKRCLPERSAERGSAVVEAVAAIVVLMFLVLAVIEVAFALYARNVVLASAHEGARAAVELGRSTSEANDVARRTVERAAGRLVRDLDVATTVQEFGGRQVVEVQVHALLNLVGPVPFHLPVSSVATAGLSREP